MPRRRFRGGEQGSAIGRILDEFGAFHVEALGAIVLGVDEHRADGDALGGYRDATQSVGEDVGAEPSGRVAAA